MLSESVLETVKLRTGIDPNFLADTLTTDIELTDALFDLIDNSIDSARDQIVQGEFEKDARGLPHSYAGYEIKLRFSSNSIIIEDNCTGVDTETLETKAFYTGLRSNHRFGIGYYGLGLKRALLKAGDLYGMVTDNGNYLYKSVFSSRSFASDGEAELRAKKYHSRTKPRTIFVVSQLHTDIQAQIANPDWVRALINSLAVRYGIFLKKGLKIKVVCSIPSLNNTYNITPEVPTVRSDLLLPIRETMDTGGVLSEFIVGAHEKYKFPGEWEHDANESKKLTSKYGVYYIFNDRVIVDASLDKKHGFTTNWHSEYGGFVCLVFVTGENPKDLPWNTAKTDVKLYSPLFVQIKSRVEPLAKSYRSEAKKLINIWTNPSTKNLPEIERKKIFSEKTGAKLIPYTEISATSRKKVEKLVNAPITGKKHSNQQSKDINLRTTETSPKAASKNSSQHTKSWECLLPRHFPVCQDDAVLNNLIIEAISLKIEDSPHASIMLYRALFEAAFKHFVKQAKQFQAVKEHFYSKGAGRKKDHNEEYRKSQGIDLSMCSHWIVDNNNVFPPESSKRLSLCAKNLRKHIQFMNGVVHGNQIVGNDSKAQNIRNETVELLEFLAIGELNND